MAVAAVLVSLCVLSWLFRVLFTYNSALNNGPMLSVVACKNCNLAAYVNLAV